MRTVLWGPCRGLRYRIFPGYGWAYIYGGWERSLTRLMVANIRAGATVYDLGANYGMHTLLFARLVGGVGKVYAFEPHPQIFSSLKEHLELNGIQTVVPLCMAVSDSSGWASFDEAHHRGAGHLTESGVGTARVRTTSLDDFVFQGDALPPTFIKIDIEGLESRALKGGVRTLEVYGPTMMIELHNPSEDRGVGSTLKGLGYRAFRVRDGRPVEVKNMTSGWPDPDGIWGVVLAISKTGSKRIIDDTMSSYARPDVVD